MPPKNAEFGSGVLYLAGDPIGEPLKISLMPVGVPEDVEFVSLIRGPVECTFTSKISRNDCLSLVHGHKVTNNWLKMHGGIMTRRYSK